MAKPYDTRLIMMVSQMRFETQDMNQFCKLIPVVYADGVRLTVKDFPNDGEIWWMLTARTAPLAEPGRLVTGTVENAVRYDEFDATSSRFQVQRESVRDLELKDGAEILSIPGDAIENIQDIVSSGFRMDVTIRPTPMVMLRWRGHAYGPFRTSADPFSAAKAAGGAAFAPSNTDMTVYKIVDRAFDDDTNDHRVLIDELVSPTTHRRSEGYELLQVKRDLLLGSGYERILANSPEKLVLEPIDRKLQRYAKQSLSRTKRQQLRVLLDELEIGGRESQEAEELVHAVGRIKRVTEAQDAALDAVAKALLESGALGPERIRKAEQAFADKFVQEQAAQLQAKAEESLLVLREELRRAETDLKGAQTRLNKEESDRRAKHEQLIAAEREAAQKGLVVERQELEKQKLELDRQQQVLQKNLEHVTMELRDAGDKVVNRFLTIAPLLGSLGVPGGHRLSTSTTNASTDPAAIVATAFELPSFISAISPAKDQAISEEAFFDRFQRVVEDSGFVYRPVDLQRFHMSVKCGEMTVLGGPSGTGKSSLPALYTQALIGEETTSGRPECLMVNINPSWMDIRDLLGHMNTLEGRFFPAESGLFQHLVHAFEEYRAKGKTTGLYLTCLDEMNLSQVEHYFSDFMMVLDRHESSRAIHCFAPEVVKASCPFRAYARLPLSPGAKFVGTVNFDETTRLLSDRFLDRVNLIRLTAGSLPTVAGGGSAVKVAGRMITLADFEVWRTDAALPSDLGSLLDSIRPLLHQMGCPLSPRTYRGICRFVGSSGQIMPSAKAFDVQIAQRVIPKMRSLITKRQLESLDLLMQLMSSPGVCAFEESLPLLDGIRDSAGARAWDLEE